MLGGGGCPEWQDSDRIGSEDRKWSVGEGRGGDRSSVRSGVCDRGVRWGEKC